MNDYEMLVFENSISALVFNAFTLVFKYMNLHSRPPERQFSNLDCPQSFSCIFENEGASPKIPRPPPMMFP